jgi:DNA-binding transcriptional regulator PaaX
MREDLFEAVKFLSVLAKVQKWESMNSHLMRTTSSRQLYFGLIRHLAKDGDAFLVDSMKDIYFDDGVSLTERGVRLAIRSFEAAGVLTVEKAVLDRRSRRIYLTEKLQNQMLLHASALRSSLNESFMVLDK